MERKIRTQGHSTKGKKDQLTYPPCTKSSSGGPSSASSGVCSSPTLLLSQMLTLQTHTKPTPTTQQTQDQHQPSNRPNTTIHKQRYTRSQTARTAPTFCQRRTMQGWFH